MLLQELQKKCEISIVEFLVIRFLNDNELQMDCNKL